MTLPAAVAAVCDAWLRQADRLAPGLVTGLFLRGGVAFGEFVPGTSDVDFVATLARRPSYDDEEALRASHEELQSTHPDVPFDGMHLLASDLEADPEECPDVPCVLHGWFEPAARYDVSPVAWHELATRGIVVRGELPQVWTSQDRLLSSTRAHLATQWADQAAALARFPEEAAAEASTWCVLGAARLDHLLTTGELTSKSAAGRWGLGHYEPRWHRVLREALRVREGSGPPEYDDPAERGADVAAFTAYVVGRA